MRMVWFFFSILTIPLLGTVSGALPNDSSKFGMSYKFDGIDDYIQIPYSDDFNFSKTNEFTLMTWAKVNSQPAAQAFASFYYIHYSYYYIFQSYILPSSIGIYVWNSTGSTGCFVSSSNTGNWGFFTFVCNGTHIKLYKNGVLRKTCAFSGSIKSVTPSYKVCIGCRYPGDNTFNGTLDEVAIYNRSLSQEEIQNHYALGSGKYYWKVVVNDSSTTNESDTQYFVISSSSPSINRIWRDKEVVYEGQNLTL